MVTTTQDLANALRYGPQTAGLVRRSAYLEDALRSMAQPEQQIRSPVELGARLVAMALLNRASNKAQNATLAAVNADRKQRLATMLGGLPDAPLALAPTPQAPPPQVVAPPTAPPPAAPPVQPAGLQVTPQDRDALIRMLSTEAIGEGPEGMAAAGHVALNRLRTGFMGAKTLGDVIHAPHQFSGMANAAQVSPQDYEAASKVADGLLSGQTPDPTGGAINFLNPELTLQQTGHLPAWAQGQGQRIGRHVFFGGNPSAVQQAAAAAPAAPAGPETSAQPYQVAALGETPPPPAQASAPAVSPPVDGAPPAVPPQAAAGGMPRQANPWAQRAVMVRKLLTSPDPEDQARGEAEYWKLQEEMTKPTQYDVKVDGAHLILTNPTDPNDRRVVPIPELMAKDAPAPAGVTPGTVGQRAADNTYKVIQTPPPGYQGPATAQTFVRGGPADPGAGTNLVNNEGKLRDDYAKEIAPYVVAREGLRKVVEAAKTGNPAGDIALVFGYMKTLDPGSTVREGEQAQVANSGTIPQTVTNIYNKLLTGQGSLLPAQRAQFADSAYRQFQVYQRTFDAANQRYGDLAKSYGFDPNRVVRTFDPIEPFKAPPTLPPAAAATFDRLKQAGKLDTRQPLGSAANPFVARDAATAQALDKPENRGKHIIMPDGSVVEVH